MNRMRQLVLRLVACCAALAPVVSLGEIVRDQYWPANSDGQWDFCCAPIAATIAAGKSGWLDRIELPIDLLPLPYSPPLTHGGDLYWSLCTFDAQGLPVSTPATTVAYGTVPGTAITTVPGITIDVRSFDLYVEPGDKYALTLMTWGPHLRWFSYWGYDAPQGTTFEDRVVYWFAYPPSPTMPAYSTAYTTYIDTVPEPTLLALCASGLSVASLCVRRRRNRIAEKRVMRTGRMAGSGTATASAAPLPAADQT